MPSETSMVGDLGRRLARVWADMQWRPLGTDVVTIEGRPFGPSHLSLWSPGVSTSCLTVDMVRKAQERRHAVDPGPLFMVSPAEFALIKNAVALLTRRV